MSGHPSSRRFFLFLLPASALMHSCSLLRPGPGQTVRRFYQALEAGKADEAISCISPRFRAQVGDDKLKRLLLISAEKERAEHGGLTRVEILKEAVRGDSARVDYRLRYKDGTASRRQEQMERIEGRWYITATK